MITLLRAADPELLDRLRATREAGEVPLVGDNRWPAAQWDAVRRIAADAELPPRTAWAALTSGSSGAPRIVLRSAESWAESFATVADLLGVGEEDAVLLPAPASSSLTLFSLAHALENGPAALGTASASTTPVVALHATPQGLGAALDAPATPPLRSALIGGSHLDPALRARAEAAGIRTTAYYGAAELSFVAVDPDGHGLLPFPGVEIAIRQGVLWVRSPFVASGYAGAPGPLARDGSWASVGDHAELADGRLRLLGRTDDAVLSASATIVPEEVEAVLRSVPGVRDAVVFGIPRGPIGALVAALIEPEPDASGPLTAASLRRITGEQLAPAHRPRRWFAGALPRTASGKPARAEAARQVRDEKAVRID